MNKRKRIYFSLILITTLFQIYSCNLQSSPQDNADKIIKQFVSSPDSIRIPKSPPDNENIKFYYQLMTWIKKLNIQSKESTFTIRAWMGVGGLIRTQKLIIIEKKSGVLSAKIYKFDRIFNEFGISRDSIKNINIKDIIPKSGWVSFSEKFFFPEFLSLFKLDRQYGEPGGIDSEGYYLEILTNSHYWMSDFPDPFLNESTHEDVLIAKRIFGIIKDNFFSQADF